MNNCQTIGQGLASQISQIGYPCKCVDVVCSAQLATYYFDLDNSMDINKINDKMLNIVNDINHRAFSFTDKKNHSFALCEGFSVRNTLCYGDVLKPQRNVGYSVKIPVGLDTYNNPLELDFEKIPHILIAGTTGSGKSVLQHTIITALYHTTYAGNFDLVLIDTKFEMSRFNNNRNVKYIETADEAVAYLSDLCKIMDARYEQIKRSGAKQKPIFVMIDELGDLMLASRYDVEASIVRLAQKARGANIHLILATQRPSVDVVSGLIRANMPCRICLKTASYRDSVIVLEHKGAEKLLGCGDAIIKLPYQLEEVRFQVAYSKDETIKQVMNWNK